MRWQLIVPMLVLLVWVPGTSQLWAQSSQEVPCPPRQPETYCVLLKQFGFLRPFAVSPDGQLLATFWFYYWPEEGTFFVLQLPQGGTLRTFSHRKNIGSMAFSSDSRLLAAGTGDGKIKLWEATTGKLIHTIDTQTLMPIQAVAFSPDGRWLAFSTCESKDPRSTCEPPNVGKINLWELATGRLIRVLTGRGQGKIMKLAFSPDSQILAAAWDRGVVDTWEVATGRRVFSIENAMPMPFFDVAFSPDGQLLATDYCLKYAGHYTCGQAEVRLWNVKNGALVRALPGITPYNGNVNSLSFSPTGKFLVAGMFQQLKIWDVASGAEVRTIPAKVVKSVAFIPPDGHWLAYSDFEMNSGDVIKLRYVGDLPK